jgi:hypothetical protein
MGKEDQDRWLTMAQLSDRLNIPVKTLRDWRLRGNRDPELDPGPRSAKLGGHVRYRLSDVVWWERAQEIAAGQR